MKQPKEHQNYLQDLDSERKAWERPALSEARFSGTDRPCTHPRGFCCRDCGAQAIGLEPEVVEAKPCSCAQRRRHPTMLREWPVDQEGFFLLTMTGRHNGLTKTIPCFTDHRDPVTGERRPFHPKEPILYKDDLMVLTGLGRAAFAERSAHFPGRVPFLHEVACFTEVFMREYYWPRENRRRGRRADRKAAVQQRHTDAGCTDPACRKRHK